MIEEIKVGSEKIRYVCERLDALNFQQYTN